MYLACRVRRAIHQDYVDLLWYLFGIVTSLSTVGEALALCKITRQARA